LVWIIWASKNEFNGEYCAARSCIFLICARVKGDRAVSGSGQIA